MKIQIMHRVALALLFFMIVPAAWASKEGVLPLSEFRLASGGIGSSGKVVVEGRWNVKDRFTESKVTAFGKDFVASKQQLKALAKFGANGLRLSYDAGYPNLGGKTVYIQFQTGFSSGTRRRIGVTVQANGNFKVDAVENGDE